MAQARRRPGLKLPGALLGIALASAGCGGSGGLVERYPALADVEGQRLADANPYVLPHEGRVRFFFCHWDTSAPIPVSVAGDVTEPERDLIDAALAAWQRAGLGVRFEQVPFGTPGIELSLIGGTVDTPVGQDTANTIVDCAIAPLSRQTGGSIVDARIVRAQIRIARITNADWQEKQRPLTDAELAGTLLHELGHALGFQGHARHGDTIMVREVERIARAGKQLLDDGAFRDPTLRALYRLPNGALAGGGPVDRCRTDHVDRMARLAESNGLAGPFVRVGEAAGRIIWRDANGAEYALLVAKLREGLRDPERLLVIPEARVRASLAEGLDAQCHRSE